MVDRTSSDASSRLNGVRPVARFRVAEAVAAVLRERILDEAGAGGYRLPPQDHLIQEFEVSHASIREAIRILETEGLVTVRRGKIGGAEVHLPDQASAAYHVGLALQAGQVTIDDLATGLQVLEPQCAAACARRSDRASEVVPVLRASIERSAELVGDGPGFTHAGREFHHLIVALTPNATMRYVVGALVALWSAQEEAWAELATRSGAYASPADAEAMVETHRRILDLIEAGDGPEAERAAREHLVVSQRYVIERLRDGVVDATSTVARQAIQATRTWQPN